VLSPGQNFRRRISGKAAIEVVPHHHHDRQLDIRIQEGFQPHPEPLAQVGWAGDQKLLELIQNQEQLLLSGIPLHPAPHRLSQICIGSSQARTLKALEGPIRRSGHNYAPAIASRHGALPQARDEAGLDQRGLAASRWPHD